jgi:hypothetical protein
LSEIARRLLHVFGLPLRTVLVDEQRDHLGLGNKLTQQSEPFCPQESCEERGASHVGARAVEARDEAFLDRVLADAEDDRNGTGGRFRRPRRLVSTNRDEHVHAAADKLRRERWQSIVLTLSPAKFDCHVAALDVARCGKGLAEGSDGSSGILGRAGT